MLIGLAVVLFVVLCVVVKQELVLQRFFPVLRPTHLFPPFCARFLTLLVLV